MSTVHYTTCPVCGSAEINPLLTIKDHSVSKETFVIWQCSWCTLRFTQDAPDQNTMHAYYLSQGYISHTNTTKGLINKVYQKVRNHTLAQKATLVIAKTKKVGSILDMGAGTGAFLNTMKKKGWEMLGIEPDEGARNQALKLYGIQLQEMLLPAITEKRFDAITLWHVMEHVHELHNTLQRLKSLLLPEGRLLIAVPNYESLDCEIYKLCWAAYDVPRHLYHFTPRSIEVLLHKNGLKIIDKKPMWFDSFYISLLSTQYQNGKTSWLGAGISGLRSNVTAFFNKDRSSSVIYIVGKA